mmetsp:Transcript_80369/g.192752  ORF Transcript_80369/g.192752 Transcript_80369/m.192752 type:complete len:236 (-) Transcript_80369:458-1165(-)
MADAGCPAVSAGPLRSAPCARCGLRSTTLRLLPLLGDLWNHVQHLPRQHTPAAHDPNPSESGGQDQHTRAISITRVVVLAVQLHERCFDVPRASRNLSARPVHLRSFGASQLLQRYALERCRFPSCCALGPRELLGCAADRGGDPESVLDTTISANSQPSHLADWGFSFLCPCAVHHSECERSWPQCLQLQLASTPRVRLRVVEGPKCSRRGCQSRRHCSVFGLLLLHAMVPITL